MIFSKEQMFSDSQPLTGAVTGAAATNVIDLGVGAAGTGTVRGAPAKLIRDVGPGEPVAVSVTAFCSSAAPATETLTVTLLQSDAANMSAPDTLATSRTMTVAQKGVSFAFNFLPDQITKRYLSLTYTTVGANNIVVDAGITLAKQSNVTVAAA
jgi:hypothetical protein